MDNRLIFLIRLFWVGVDVVHYYVALINMTSHHIGTLHVRNEFLTIDFAGRNTIITFQVFFIRIFHISYLSDFVRTFESKSWKIWHWHNKICGKMSSKRQKLIKEFIGVTGKILSSFLFTVVLKVSLHDINHCGVTIFGNSSLCSPKMSFATPDVYRLQAYLEVLFLKNFILR